MKSSSLYRERAHTPLERLARRYNRAARDLYDLRREFDRTQDELDRTARAKARAAR